MNAQKPPRHTVLFTCPECDGKGRHELFSFETGQRKAIPCELCHTTGTVGTSDMERRRIGNEFRERRVNRGLTTMQWARRTGLDLLTVSHAERGIIDPEILRAGHEKGDA